MPESALVEKARRWVVDNYPYNREHLLRALEWLDRLAPNAREAVRLAALTHDMERAFPGPDSPVMASLDDPVYERLHSERSARIVRDWMRGHGADDALVRDVEELILAHEIGGSHDADLVQAADRLSFLETNIDLFLGFVQSGRFSIVDVRTKFEHSYHRIQVPDAKAIALPLYEKADARLASLALTPPRA
jgi:HD domain